MAADFLPFLGASSSGAFLAFFAIARGGSDGAVGVRAVARRGGASEVACDGCMWRGETEGRVVEMEGLGAYPCGGTHVATCDQVGKVEVRKIARSKGVSRVSYRVA